jgi:hypothetical protein
MNPSFIIPGVGVVCFVCGVVFSKAILSETATIKQHVTESETRIRADIASLLSKTASKV